MGHCKTYGGGGAGAGEVQKKYSLARENYMKKKNSCTPINPKKIFML